MAENGYREVVTKHLSKSCDDLPEATSTKPRPQGQLSLPQSDPGHVLVVGQRAPVVLPLNCAVGCCIFERADRARRILGRDISVPEGKYCRMGYFSLGKRQECRIDAC